MRLARPGVTLVGMIVAAWLAACGFSGNPAAIDGGAPADAGPGDPDAGPTLDGAAADARSSCTARWLAGPTFAPPVPVTAVNSAAAEADPFITADELAIYFARASNVFAATRPTAGDAFATPTQVMGLSSSSNESKATLTADGLTAFVNSARPGGEGNTDLWRGTRNATSDAWVMDQIGLAQVNTSGEQWDPHVSGDGLRLYLAPGGSPQYIAVASRISTAAAFGPTVPIGEILSSAVDNDPSLTGDERVIAWSSLRTGERRMHYATRSGPTAMFDSPQLLPGDFQVNDDGAAISADGCRLYFVTDRGGGRDIYVAELE